MGVPRADIHCLYMCTSSHPALLPDVGTLPSISPPSCGLFGDCIRFISDRIVSNDPTFDNVAVDRGSELLSGLLVEVLAVNDPHLFEESRLAALASAEQQDLY